MEHLSLGIVNKSMLSLKSLNVLICFIFEPNSSVPPLSSVLLLDFLANSTRHYATSIHVPTNRSNSSNSVNHMKALTFYTLNKENYVHI